jgi:hypothetical protein
MKQLLLMIFFVASFFQASSQPNFYERTYGLGRGVFIDKAANGNFIIGANKGTSPIYSGYYFLIDPNGDTLWTRTTSNSSLSCIRQLSDKGYILIGDTVGSPKRLAKVNRVDSLGNILWFAEYPTDDWGTWGNSIISNYDNGYFIGVVNDGDQSENTYYVIKTDSLGQTIDTAVAQYPQSSFRQHPNSMQMTSDSGVVVAPSTAVYGVISIVKLSAALDSQWTKKYFPPNGFELNGNYIVQTSDSGYLIVGYKDSLAGSFSHCGYIMRTGANGDSLWAKTFCEPNKTIRFTAVLEDSNGDLFISGEYRSGDSISVMIMKTNSVGISIWSRIFSGYGFAFPASMIFDSSQNPMLVGYTRDTLTNLEYIYLIKADSLLSVSSFDNSKNAKLFDVYPNPVSSSLSVYSRLKNESLVSLRLRNVLGQILYFKTEINFNDRLIHQIDMREVAKGMYFLEISTNANKSTYKILKN